MPVCVKKSFSKMFNCSHLITPKSVFYCDDDFEEKNMTAVAERILQDALGLLPVERAELIEKLFQSFDRPTSSKVDEAWAEEVESRIDAYERGEIKASSAEDVLARINQR